MGGNAPLVALSALSTVSEKDEQKGMEQFILGIYVGIRNPRTHDAIEDSEDYAIKALVTVDLALGYLKREAQEFDIQGFVDRLYDPHFVPSPEYAQALVAEVPPPAVDAVFAEGFARQDQGDAQNLKFAFTALYQLMNDEQLGAVTRQIGEILRNERESGRIARLFRLVKPPACQTTLYQT